MLFAAAPNRPKVKPPAPSHLIADYPDDVSGVLMESPEWTEIDEVMPSDKSARHALAAALSSGLIPGHTVAQFDGQHADIQLASLRPVLWVCRTKPIPAASFARQTSQE
jgi:hypothetical protein